MLTIILIGRGGELDRVAVPAPDGEITLNELGDIRTCRGWLLKDGDVIKIEQRD